MDLLKLVETQLAKKTVGTLTLGKRKYFREVFFEAESVYLIGTQYSGKISATALAKLGFPGGALSRNRFEEFIQTIDLKHKTLAEGLFEAGLLGSERFGEILVDQLTEEILELFHRGSGSFHFQEGRVPEYLLNGETITGRTPIPLRVVAGELRARASEAAVFDEIFPSPEEIFVFTERGLATRHETEKDVALLLTLELVDGLRTLSDIVIHSRLYEHQVYAALRTALDKGYLKKTIFPELRGISTQNLSVAEAARYLPYFINAVKHGADELAARERLAVLYEKLGRIEDAVREHAAIGDLFRKANKPAKAIKAYLRALNLVPTDAEIKRRAGDIYIEAAEQEIRAGNEDQSIAFLECALRLFPTDERIFDRLLELLLSGAKVREISNLCDWKIENSKSLGCPEAAVPVCERAVRGMPRAQLLRKKLINLYLDIGRTEDAKRELKELFEQYVAGDEIARAHEIIEKLRRLGEQPAVVVKLEGQIAKIGAAARHRPRANRGHLQTVVFATILVVLGYQLAGLYFWSRIKDSALEAAGTTPGTEARLVPSPEELRSLEAAEKCRRFLRWFTFHPLKDRATEVLRTAEGRAQNLREERARRAEETLRRVQNAAAEGDRETGMQYLSALLELPPGDRHRAEAERLAQALRSIEVSARELLTRAQELEEQASHENDQQAWELAYDAYSELIEKFPASKLTRGLRLPIWVDTLPRGAEVYEILSPGRTRLIAQAPLVYRLLPGELAVFELKAPGYSTLTARLTDSGRGDVCFRLSRLPQASTELPGSVEYAPILTENEILLGTNAGVLVCMDRATLAQLWKWRRQEDDLQRTLGVPLHTEHGLITAWSDAKIRRLSPRAGSRTYGQEPLVTTKPLRGLPCTPLRLLPEAAAIALGTKENLVEFYDAKTLDFLGASKLEKTEERPTFAAEVRGRVLVGTKKGSVFAVDPKTFAAEKLRDGRGDAIVEISVADRTAVARTESGQLLFLEGASGMAEKWPFLLPPQAISLAVTAEEKSVAVLEPRGMLHIIRLDGGPTTTRELGFEGAKLEALPGAIAVLDASRCQLLLAEPSTGAPIWAARAEARIVALAADRLGVAVITEDAARGMKSRLALYPRQP